MTTPVSHKTTDLEQQILRLTDYVRQQREHILNLEKAAIHGSLAARRDSSIWNDGNDGNDLETSLDQPVYDEHTTALLYKSKKRLLACDVVALEAEISLQFQNLQLVKNERQKQEKGLQEITKALKSRKNELRTLNNTLEKVQFKAKVQTGNDNMNMNSTNNILNKVQIRDLQSFQGASIENSVHTHHHHYPPHVPTFDPPVSSLPPITMGLVAPLPITLVDRTRSKVRKVKPQAHLEKMPKWSKPCKRGNDCVLKTCRYLHPRQLELYSGDKLTTLGEEMKSDKK